LVNTDRIAVIFAYGFRKLTDGTMAKAHRSQLDLLPPPSGRVVFLGDSITCQGLWDEWFPELTTLNRGISGDTVEGVTRRLDGAINASSVVSLLIGTNDLTGLGRSRKVEDIASQVAQLSAWIIEGAPQATLLINSVVPRTAWFAPRIQALNGLYRSIADHVGASYVDLWPVFAGPDNALRREFTRDNLHLNGPGYRAWTDVLRPQLMSFAG
jgi:lysophospholipase L1-like esterase